MDAVVSQQHAAPFLPEITTHRNKQRKPTQYSWMKQEKESKILSKSEISLFKNSMKQNICVELLQQGYHRSFSKLFFLLSFDQDRRAKADPDQTIECQTPLDEQRDKLETIRLHLSRAEKAERTLSWTVVCDQHLFLGRYFSSPEDVWLCLYFLHSCADREQGGCSRPATEARACLAEVYLRLGEVANGKQQAELCIQQAEGCDWMDSDGQPLTLRGYKALWEAYKQLANAGLEAEDYSEALAVLHEGHGLTIESGDKLLEAEARYRLGLAYQSTGDHDTAKQFFNTSMQMYSTLQNAEGLGRSYQALSKSVKSEGNINYTIECLENIVDISRSNGLQDILADVFLSLGSIYFMRRQYARAYEYSLQGYEILCNLGDVALLKKAQVSVASARAHLVMGKYSADMASESPAALQRLLTWKNTGGYKALSTDSTATAWY